MYLSLNFPQIASNEPRYHIAKGHINEDLFKFGLKETFQIKQFATY